MGIPFILGYGLILFFSANELPRHRQRIVPELSLAFFSH